MIAGDTSNRCGSWSGLFRIADDRYPVAADLLRDVAVKILSRYDLDLAVGRVRRIVSEAANATGHRGEYFHGSSANFACKIKDHVTQNVIL